MALSVEAPTTPILAVVDLQSHSRQVVQHALSLADEQHRPLVVLHVVHETEESAGFYRHHDDGNYALPMKEIAGRLLRQLVEALTDGYGESVGRIATRLVEGVPAGRIVEVAEQVDAHSIVMMNDDCQGLERIWHCSVAKDVLKHTRRNLVLLRPDLAGEMPLTTDPIPATLSVAP